MSMLYYPDDWVSFVREVAKPVTQTENRITGFYPKLDLVEGKVSKRGNMHASSTLTNQKYIYS
jgi:hypothetical protein